MEYNYLPDTNIKVSKICLGTMTWGRQNTQEEAFEQMNFSLENGVNFFDTAELYLYFQFLKTNYQLFFLYQHIYLGWPEQDKVLLISERQDLREIQSMKLLREA